MGEVINLDDYRGARARREAEELARNKARELKRPTARKGLPPKSDQAEEDPTPA